MTANDTIAPRAAKPNAPSRKSVFRFWLLSAGAAFCIALALPSTAHEYAYGLIAAEKIYIPDSVYDVPQANHPTTHTFHLFNLRSRPLTVSAEPSCGCLKTSWNTIAIAPYTYRSVSITIPAGQKGDQANIAFHTDAPEKPYLFVFLRY